jgi:hypothetical protein
MLKMKGSVHENRKKGSKPLLGLPQTCAGGGGPLSSQRHQEMLKRTRRRGK